MNRRPSPPRIARGFTLVELMVALTLGAIVIASVYTLGANASRHFQEQQRVSQLQLAVRIALERLRRDASMAGFGGTPASALEPACGTVAGTPAFFGVTVVDRDTSGMAALGTMAGAAASLVHADRVRFSGNLDTSDIYLVRDYLGTTINLQTDWMGFRRSFANDYAGTISEALFQQTFAPGRVVRITHPSGGTFFAVIASSSFAGAARVTLTASLPACADVCTGCTIAPLSGVEYFLAEAPAALAPVNAAATGPNTVLMRGEWNLSTGASIAGTARPILEWAVHFDAVPIVNTAALGVVPPTLVPQVDTSVAGVGALRPSAIYALDLTVGARTPEQDDRFPWIAPAAGDPLTRFRAFTDRPGAMRVRTARAEVLLPNIAYRGM
jgi:prepilin-type N-terminal cleavage/methylation domain-containing protein